MTVAAVGGTGGVWSKVTSFFRRWISPPTGGTARGDYAAGQRIRAWIIIGLAVVVLLASLIAYGLAHCWMLAGLTVFAQGCVWYPVTTASSMSQRALDWGLWSLIGTMLFTLQEAAGFYRQLPRGTAQAPAASLEGQPAFDAYWPWYVATLLRGPIIAVMLMLLLSSAASSLFGATPTDGVPGLNTSGLDSRVAVALACILGYYHRVARNLLDGLVKRIFTGSWNDANLRFVIKPEAVEAALGESIALETSPRTDVEWTASQGVISATGVYTAPDKSGSAGETVIITAKPPNAAHQARSLTVPLVPYRIIGPDAIRLLDVETSVQFRMSPVLAGTSWMIAPGTDGHINSTTGLYTASCRQKRTATTVTVIAEANRPGEPRTRREKVVTLIAY